LKYNFFLPILQYYPILVCDLRYIYSSSANFYKTVHFKERRRTSASCLRLLFDFAWLGYDLNSFC